MKCDWCGEEHEPSDSAVTFRMGRHGPYTIVGGCLAELEAALGLPDLTLLNSELVDRIRKQIEAREEGAAPNSGRRICRLCLDPITEHQRYYVDRVHRDGKLVGTHYQHVDGERCLSSLERTHGSTQ